MEWMLRNCSQLLLAGVASPSGFLASCLLLELNIGLQGPDSEL